MIILGYIYNHFAFSRETHDNPRVHVELIDQGIQARYHGT